MTESAYKGKFVCWGNDERGFCFARIESEAMVNTAEGLRGVFIVVDRMSSNGNGVNHYPTMTTLRKDRIDLEKDVFDRKQGMEDLTNDQLFMLALAGRAEGVVHKGVANMLEAEQGKPLEALAKARLKDRMGLEADEEPESSVSEPEEGPNVMLGLAPGGAGVLGYARSSACRNS